MSCVRNRCPGRWGFWVCFVWRELRFPRWDPFPSWKGRGALKDFLRRGGCLQGSLLLAEGEDLGGIGGRIAAFSGEVCLAWKPSLAPWVAVAHHSLISVVENWTWCAFSPVQRVSLSLRNLTLRGEGRWDVPRGGLPAWSRVMLLRSFSYRVVTASPVCSEPFICQALHNFDLPFFSSLHVPLNSLNKAPEGHPSRVPASRPTSVLSFTPATPSWAPFFLVIYSLTSKRL